MSSPSNLLELHYHPEKMDLERKRLEEEEALKEKLLNEWLEWNQLDKTERFRSILHNKFDEKLKTLLGQFENMTDYTIRTKLAELATLEKVINATCGTYKD